MRARLAHRSRDIHRAHHPFWRTHGIGRTLVHLLFVVHCPRELRVRLSTGQFGRDCAYRAALHTHLGRTLVPLWRRSRRHVPHTVCARFAMSHVAWPNSTLVHANECVDANTSIRLSRLVGIDGRCRRGTARLSTWQDWLGTSHAHSHCVHSSGLHVPPIPFPPSGPSRDGTDSLWSRVSTARPEI